MVIVTTLLKLPLSSLLEVVIVTTLQCLVDGGSQISVPGLDFSEFYENGGSNYHTLLEANKRPGLALLPQNLLASPSRLLGTAEYWTILYLL